MGTITEGSPPTIPSCRRRQPTPLPLIRGRDGHHPHLHSRCDDCRGRARSWCLDQSLGALARAESARREVRDRTHGDWRLERHAVRSARRGASHGGRDGLPRQGVYESESRGFPCRSCLLGGLPGKISTHTPEACYQRGWLTTRSLPTTSSTPTAPAASRQNSAPPWPGAEGQARPLCGSSGLGTPVGAGRPLEEPRWEFGSESALCKLYVIRETWGRGRGSRKRSLQRFLGCFPARTRPVCVRCSQVGCRQRRVGSMEERSLCCVFLSPHAPLHFRDDVAQLNDFNLDSINVPSPGVCPSHP